MGRTSVGRGAMSPNPMPAEIQAMHEEDTQCQYCGVSYLVHREVKMLKVSRIVYRV
jgi:hypothetical protein